MSDDLVSRLQTLSHPASESLPDGKRLTLLILIAREAADAIERKDAALRVAVKALNQVSKVPSVRHTSGHLHDCAWCNGSAGVAEYAIAKIKEALND